MSQGLASAGVAAEVGLRQLVTFTSNGSFTKATYPWLKRVHVKAVGGGGGGGGSATTGAGQVSSGGGGGSGGYVEELIEVDALSASETVTVGGGGAGGVGVTGTAGTASTFGAHNSAGAGTGGVGGVAATPLGIAGSGGSGGASTGGDLNITGSNGGSPQASSSSRVLTGTGGASLFGSVRDHGWIGASVDGADANDYGSGGVGGGCVQSSGSTQTGGDGSDGLVVCYLYG